MNVIAHGQPICIHHYVQRCEKLLLYQESLNRSLVNEQFDTIGFCMKRNGQTAQQNHLCEMGWVLNTSAIEINRV